MEGSREVDYVLALAASAFAPSFSIPGKLIAIFLNRVLTLCPALAEVSMNIMLSWVDFWVASSSVTCLRPRSVRQDMQRGVHTPFVGEIGFVTDKDNNNVRPSLGSHVVNPFTG